MSKAAEKERKKLEKAAEKERKRSIKLGQKAGAEDTGVLFAEFPDTYTADAGSSQAEAGANASPEADTVVDGEASVAAGGGNGEDDVDDDVLMARLMNMFGTGDAKMPETKAVEQVAKKEVSPAVAKALAMSQAAEEAEKKPELQRVKKKAMAAGLANRWDGSADVAGEEDKKPELQRVMKKDLAAGLANRWDGSSDVSVVKPKAVVATGGNSDAMKRMREMAAKEEEAAKLAKEASSPKPKGKVWTAPTPKPNRPSQDGEEEEEEEDVNPVVAQDDAAFTRKGSTASVMSVTKDNAKPAVFISGATGAFAPAINGIFKETDEFANGKPVCCKVGVVPLWIWYTADSRWALGGVIGSELKSRAKAKFDLEHTNPFAVSVQRGARVPSVVRQWRISNGKGEWPIDSLVACVSATKHELTLAESVAEKDTAIAKKYKM